MEIDTEPELRKAVEGRLGFGVSDERWRETKQDNCPVGPWGPGDVVALCKALRDPGERKRRLFGKAANESDQRFAVPEVERSIRECREFLFQRNAAPFGDLESAGRWIIQRAREENELELSSPGFGFGDLAQFAAPVILAFPGKQAVSRVMIPGLCPLAALATAGRSIAAATLCEPYQAVGHILTGIPVLIWPVKVTETVGWGETLHPRRVTIEVNFDWVTKADVADFYQDSREPASPTSRDDCLAFFRKGMSGTPPELLELWNKTYPQWAYKTLGSFKTAMSRSTY